MKGLQERIYHLWYTHQLRKWQKFWIVRAETALFTLRRMQLTLDGDYTEAFYDLYLPIFYETILAEIPEPFYSAIMVDVSVWTSYNRARWAAEAAEHRREFPDTKWEQSLPAYLIWKLSGDQNPFSPRDD